MSGALKYEAFCLDPSETWMFAGNACGEIVTINIDSMFVEARIQAHCGIIQAIASHPTLPYVAALSTDRTVSLWGRREGELTFLNLIPLRSIRPSNDPSPVPFVHSTSQALGFHDSKPRLVTRSGNAGVVEVEFAEDGEYRICWCLRLHGTADLISARYVKDDNNILTGSIDGQFILSSEGQELRRWQIGKSGNVHWAEHLEGSTYLLASDMRAVARIDVSGKEPTIVGEPFTRDDLEHVTFNCVSKRAFVASFDRLIYEIDTQTCMPTGIVYRPPFKCRWVKTLRRSPSILLVQCRNGGLYKVDLNTGKCISVIKETPGALWTAVNLPGGRIAIAGDGETLTLLSVTGVARLSRATRFSAEKCQLAQLSASYTKRMVLNEQSGCLVMGRTNGDVVVADLQPGLGSTSARVLRNVESPVRDLAIVPDGSGVFVACEDGSVKKIDLASGEILTTWKSAVGQPIWSIAHCPGRAVVAAAERGGNLVILDDVTLEVLFSDIRSGRPKRMKFVGTERLLYNRLDQIFSLDLTTCRETLLLDSQGNTIEDFIWDRDQRYLVAISYTQNITLCDFHSGEILSIVPDQIDYSKGLVWVKNTDEGPGYPLDFLTFGRSGSSHYFRIHDEKILAMGPVDAISVTDQ
jgi:WD40 repeat protein